MRYNIIFSTVDYRLERHPVSQRLNLSENEARDVVIGHAGYNYDEVTRIFAALQATRYMSIRPKGYLQEQENRLQLDLYIHQEE